VAALDPLWRDMALDMAVFDPGPYAADVVFASIVLQNSARRIFKKYSFVAELSCVSMIQYSRAA
jgi:hypothetical protein